MCLISHPISGPVPMYTSEVISFTSLAHSDLSIMAKRSLSLTTNFVSVSPPFSTCYIEVMTSGIFFTLHWFVKVINLEATECCRSLIPKSSTTCLRANVELLEYCTHPNRCEVLHNGSIKTLTGHKDRKAFLSFSGIFNVGHNSIWKLSETDQNIQRPVVEIRPLVALFVQTDTL